MKNRGIHWRRYKIQETLYIGQWCLSPLQSRHLRTSHSSPRVSSTVQNTLQNPLLELPWAAPLYFPESHQQSELSSLSEVTLVLGKASSCTMSGAEFLAKHQITQVTQPPYSPDWVPCDFWLFPKLKSPLKGKRFQTIDEIQENTMGQLMVTVSYTHLTLPTNNPWCRSRWSPYH